MRAVRKGKGLLAGSGLFAWVDTEGGFSYTAEPACQVGSKLLPFTHVIILSLPAPALWGPCGLEWGDQSFLLSGHFPDPAEGGGPGPQRPHPRPASPASSGLTSLVLWRHLASMSYLSSSTTSTLACSSRHRSWGSRTRQAGMEKRVGSPPACSLPFLPPESRAPGPLPSRALGRTDRPLCSEQEPVVFFK